MDLARTRQLLLVALSSTSPGETFNAIAAIKTMLTKAGKDIHWLASSLGSTTTASDPRIDRLNQELMLVSRQRDAAMTEANRLRRENMVLHQQNLDYRASPPGAPSAWQQQAEQLLEKCSRLTRKEADFLETITRWKGSPTERQATWLAALWEKYG